MLCPPPIPRAQAHERLLCHEVGWAPSLEPHRKLLPRGPLTKRTGLFCSSHLLLASSKATLRLQGEGESHSLLRATSLGLPTQGSSAHDLATEEEGGRQDS